jgi:thiol-disulfide isomerase/thioredoxin
LRPEIALLLGLALIVGGCDRQSAPAPQGEEAEAAGAPVAAPAAPAPVGVVDRTHAGKPMPETGFDGPDGAPLTLAAFKGKPVLLNLWATWCGPCVAEMPTLEALAKREAGRVQVIAVSQDMKGREAVEAWWRQQDLKMLKPYLDARADMSFAMGGGTLPTTLMFDAEGREVWRVSGALDWTGDEAKTLIEEALEG